MIWSVFKLFAARNAFTVMLFALAILFRSCSLAEDSCATKFIAFFTNDIEANKVLGGERGVPIANKVLAAVKPTLPRQAAESFDLIARATAYATTLPPNDPPAWTTILTTIFTPKVELPIIGGQITPKDGVELFRSEAGAALAGP